MTIPTITALPTPPQTTDDPTTFNARADAMMIALPTMVTETNVVLAAIPALVSGIDYNGTSTTSLTIGTGSKTLTTQTGKNFQVGQFVTVANTATPANYMVGQVTGYNTGTGSLTVNVTVVGGSGTYTAWTIAIAPATTLAFESGPYTPTLTGVVNVSGASVVSAMYSRIGAIVTASMRLSVTPTAGSSTSTSVRATLPVSSNLIGVGDVCGAGSHVAGSPLVYGAASISADVTNDRIYIEFNSIYAETVHTVTLTIQYVVK